MKCLVVEPSATLRRAVRNALRVAGVEEVVEASDGPQALSLADASIDLVITEWTVPGVSGIDLVQRFRANPETSRAALLLLTSRNTKDEVMRAVQAGVNGYLLKPFTFEGLRQNIERVLAGTGDDQARAA